MTPEGSVAVPERNGNADVVLWCAHAWVDRAMHNGVLIRINDDRITGLEFGVSTPPPGAERVPGVTFPGFANAHSHAFHRALRGRTHGSGGTFWTWREQMYRLAGSLTPESYLALATAAFAEMALTGITAVGEFHYLHHGPGGEPYANPNEMSHVLVEAARRAGIRITLLDTCYLHGGIGVAPNAVQQRFNDGSPHAWSDRLGGASADTAAARFGAAIHSVRAVDPTAMHAVAEFSAAWRGGVPLHAHVSEQPAENDDCLRAYGRTPVESLDHAGALTPAFTAVHATHLTANDLSLLGAARSTACFCPTTERDLGDGIGPSVELAASGAHLCLGSDSHAVVDLLEEARAVELNERLRSLQRGRHRPADLLDAATVHGHRSIGWSDAGELRVGALADLCVVGLDSVRLAGSDPQDLASAVLFGATADDVAHVMVGGRWVVRDRRHLAIDVPAALHSSITDVWESA